MAKIVVTYGVPAQGFFEHLPGHEICIPEALTGYTKPELIRIMRDADAVVACTAVDADMIATADRLKLIVCYGAGYDAIDVAAATRKGVMVCNTPSAVTAPTAELAIALLTGIARRIVHLDDLLRTMPPQQVFGMGKHMGSSLAGQTLGIVGMGRIGSMVADFGRLMGMQVLYHARAPKPERDALGDRKVPLSQLMAESDYISLHCPATPETKNLIDARMIDLMKPTACLVNTARGAVVDEAALLDALRQERIAGAALDVYPDEPNVNPAYLSLPNVILTPHCGSNTHQARYEMARQAAVRIKAVLAGETPENLLNPEALLK